MTFIGLLMVKAVLVLLAMQKTTKMVYSIPQLVAMVVCLM